jgi:hypothetical protein
VYIAGIPKTTAASIRIVTSDGAVMDEARAAGILEVSVRNDQLIAASLRAVAEEPAIADVLRAVFAAAPSLERLDIAMADTATGAAAIVRALLERPRPGLRYLALREYGFDPAVADADADRVAVSAGELAGFAAHLPDLDEFELAAPCFAGGLVHPTLRSLVLCGTAVQPGWRGLELPRLERLRWWLPGDVHGVGVDPGYFDLLWKADLFPRLTELDLIDVGFDGDVFTPTMLGSPLLRRLEVLRLPRIEETVPVSRLARLAHLRRIDVRSESGEATMRALPMIRVVAEQPTAAEDDAARPEMYVTAEEAFVYAWEGFAARPLFELPGTVQSVALFGVTWSPEQQRAFGAAAARFAEVHMPGGGRLAGDDLAIGLAEALPAAQWEVLHLGRAWLTRTGVTAIGGALARARTPLHTLSLRLDHRADADATDGAAAALTEGVAASALRTLTLDSDFIRTTREGRDLGEALPASLTTIRLNYLTAAGARQRRDPDALAAFLAAASARAGLQRLDVAAHPAPPDLAGILPPLVALRWREAHAAYSGAEPDTFTGERIAGVLRAQPALRELDLTDTDLAPPDVIALAAAVAVHPALECLRLSSPVMSAEAMRDLADAVGRNSSLTSLTFAQHTGFHPRHGRCERVPVTPLVAAIVESGRTFAELSLRCPGKDQLILLDLLADGRLSAVSLRGLSAAEVLVAVTALTRAPGLRKLSLRRVEFDRAGLGALCAALPALPVRELNLDCPSLWSLPAALQNKFLKALKGSGIEILRMPEPFLVLQLAGTMPSLRRIRVLGT